MCMIIWGFGSVSAEAEHGQGDDGLGGVEPEGHPDDESDLGVHRLDQRWTGRVRSRRRSRRLRTTRWASLTNWGRRQRRAQLIHRSNASTASAGLRRAMANT